MEVIQWLASNFFGIPAILLGFIVLLGLIFTEKEYKPNHQRHI